MTLKEFNQMLDELDINYYESGAYYDSSFESFSEIHRERILNDYQISVIEW